MTIHRGSKRGKPFIDLSGPSGNAYVLLGTARKLMKDLGRSSEEVSEVITEMTSGDYENLLEVFDRELGEYVDLYRG